nr:aspartic and glutamic acid-rich protein-like [Aegilops tauschii subsp. strangulata]
MWMYSGPEDTARTHPEEVDEDTAAQWLRSITGNKDNPRGSRRILPFDANNEPEEIFTKMYSMPYREQYKERVESDRESGDYHYADDSEEGSEEDNEDSGSSEEFDSPPHSERSSKQSHDPAASTAQAPTPIAQLQVSAPPATSSIPTSPLFVTHHVPKDQVGAGKEAMIQAGLMMDQLKVVYDTSKAAYDASSSLQTNVHKSCELGTKFADLEKKQIQLNLDLELAKENLKKAQDEVAVMGDKMKQALDQKDLDLAAAQKTAHEKTELADKKLASVEKLEEENANLKTVVDEAKKEVVQLKEEKVALADKVDVLTRKRDELEAYLGSLAKKMFLILEEFCQNFKEETGRIETGLDPINSLVKDEAAMNVLRLESCLAGVLDYLARLKVALSRIDKEL